MKSSIGAFIALALWSMCARGDDGFSAAHRSALEYLAANPAETDLENPSVQLRKIGERSASPASGVMVRFEQIEQGVPVLGSLVVCEVMGDGRVRIRAHEITRVDIDVVPSISRDRAIATALAGLQLSPLMIGATKSAQLAILPRSVATSGRDELIWLVAVDVDTGDDRTGGWQSIVNARDNTVHSHTNYARRNIAAETRIGADAKGGGAKTYPLMPAVLNGAFWPVHRLYVVKAGARGAPYTLQDPCYGIRQPNPSGMQQTACFEWATTSILGNTMRDAGGLSDLRLSRAKVFASSSVGYDSGGWFANATRFGDGSRTNSDRSTAGVDAFVALQKVTWVLSSLFSRAGGITGNDDPIEVHTHRNDSGSVPGGASWTQVPLTNPATFLISTNDSGTDSLGRDRTNGVGPDLIAHEAGHGLNYNIYFLTGLATGESQAIEEGNADIFAAIFEWNLSMSGYLNMTPEWIGEQTFESNWSGTSFTPALAIRYMDDPSRDAHPDPAAPARIVQSPACYSSGIGSLPRHYANGPYNHMFYLLAQGGVSQCDPTKSVTGIGYAKAALIWWDVLALSTGSMGYAQIRRKYVDAASAIYGSGSAEVLAAEAAFSAVGVN